MSPNDGINFVKSVRLRSLIKRLGVQALPDDEWGDVVERPMRIWLSSKTHPQIIYSTNIEPLFKVRSDSLTAGKFVFVERKHLLCEPYLARFLKHISVAQKSIFFLGDLSPYSLIAYLIFHECMLSNNIYVKYMGLGGKWVCKMKESSKRNGDNLFEGIQIHMSQFEVLCFKELMRLDIDWDKLIGSESVALLSASMKIEMEGAALYETRSPSVFHSILSEL